MTVKALCEIFETSLTATAIRLVEDGSLPSMLVCSHGDRSRSSTRNEETGLQLPARPPHRPPDANMYGRLALAEIHQNCNAGNAPGASTSVDTLISRHRFASAPRAASASAAYRTASLPIIRCAGSRSLLARRRMT
jgi:hypothetical protein